MWGVRAINSQLEPAVYGIKGWVEVGSMKINVSVGVAVSVGVPVGGGVKVAVFVGGGSRIAVCV